MAHMKRPLYRELAQAIDARRRCMQEPVNLFGLEIHEKTIKTCLDLLPSGAGWDNGTKIDLNASHANKIVLYGAFHHMNDTGYSGWTEHTITVKPSLMSDFDLRISGANRNDIKEYLAETFEVALRQDIAYYLYLPRFPQFAVSHRWVDQCTQEFSVCESSGVDTNVMQFRNFKSLTDAQSYAADLMEQAR
jgi:hypothetical protein